MTEILISFIIPMYNAQNDIENCLQSILREKRYPYEIILVNDGSTDDTSKIVENYVQENSRIHVTHIQNSGQGYARNLGLDLAQGEYIMFVDADDTIVANGVYEMLEIGRNRHYDVICGAYHRIEPQSEITLGMDISEGEISWNGTKKQERWLRSFRNKSAFGYLWNKLYRREFIVENNLRLDEARDVFMEDFILNLKVAERKPRYYYLPVPVYRFDVRRESTTRKADEKIQEKAIATVENYYAYLKSVERYEEQKDVFFQLAMRIFAFSLIKNMAYEGASYENTKKRIACYLDSKAYKKLLEEISIGPAVATLPSILERLLYRYCFLLLKHNYIDILSATFVFVSPLFRFYLNRNVK